MKEADLTDTVGATSEADAPTGMSMLALVRRLAFLNAPYWRRSSLVGIGLLFEMVFATALLFSFKFIIDDGAQSPPHPLDRVILP